MIQLISDKRASTARLSFNRYTVDSAKPKMALRLLDKPGSVLPSRVGPFFKVIGSVAATIGEASCGVSSDLGAHLT
jgi:hypothetical protein